MQCIAGAKCFPFHECSSTVCMVVLNAWCAIHCPLRRTTLSARILCLHIGRTTVYLYMNLSLVLYCTVLERTDPQWRYWIVELLLLLCGTFWLPPSRGFLSGIFLVGFALLRRLCLLVLAQVSARNLALVPCWPNRLIWEEWDIVTRVCWGPMDVSRLACCRPWALWNRWISGFRCRLNI